MHLILKKTIPYKNKKIICLLSIFLFCSAINTSAQWHVANLDLRYWSSNPSLHRHWHNSLFKYQNIERYPQFEYLFVPNYIAKSVANEQRFETNLFPPLRDYKVETYKFQPKFRMPIIPNIWYQPQVFVQKELVDYNNFINSTKFTKDYEDVFSERYFITEARDNYVFSHPANIQLSWDSIPEPPRLGRNGFLARRSARDGINLLLRDNAFDTHPSLERINLSNGPWTLKGTENILLSQGYVENWVKGGESSISLGSDLRLSANFKKGKHEWDNYIKIGRAHV